MVRTIKHKENRDIKIYFIGDMHLGSRTFAKEEFETLMNKIKKEKNSRIIMMGDHGDFIESDDTRRYDPANIDKKWNNSVKQYNAIKKYLEPHKHKIIGVLRGNHEGGFAKYHKELFSEEIRDHSELLSHDLKVEFLEDMGIIDLTVGKYKFNIVVAHGAGSSTNLAGQIRSLNNIINNFEVVPDVVCMGHVHALQTIVNPKMDFKFKTKIKHLGLTGNFYKTYIEGNINYASSSLFNPLPIGCIAYIFKQDGTITDEKIILG